MLKNVILKVLIVNCFFVFLFGSSAYSSDWTGHYKGTFEGTGQPMIDRVSGEWDLVVTENGYYTLDMRGVPALDQVTVRGTISDDNVINGTCDLPLSGEATMEGGVAGVSSAGTEFSVTMTGAVTGYKNWTIDAEGNISGIWVIEDLFVMLGSWQGEGTFTGSKVTPSPWECDYGGIYGGTGSPAPRYVEGLWSFGVEDDGDCYFSWAEPPLMRSVVYKGTIEEDGSFFMETDTRLVGYSTMTGSLVSDHSFSSVMEGEIQGEIEFTKDYDEEYDEEKIEGTWFIETLKRPVINWSGSGELIGS